MFSKLSYISVFYNINQIYKTLCIKTHNGAHKDILNP